MLLAQRLLKIDSYLAGAHLILNDVAKGAQPEIDGRALAAAIADLTTARDMLRDLADQPDQN